jgi:hypothetical protein
MEETNMTEKHTLIKEIGDERILLGDTYTSNPTIIFYLFGVVIFICTTLLLFKSFEYHNPGIIYSNLCISMGIGLFLTVLCIFVNTLCFGIGIEKAQAYRVSLAFTNYEIYIPKTDNPERDQIAICKAAQELECIAIQRNREKNNLDRIASKCK